MRDVYDVIIIGGGVIGCHCARELSRYQLRVLLLEKESDICSGASKANSGIVHACLSPKPGSLKARFCYEGNRLMPQVCAELGVIFKPIGALTVAWKEREIYVLRALKGRGEVNGEKDMRIVSGAELRHLEPALSERAYAALVEPSAGIVDPMMLTIAAAENAVSNGVTVLRNAAVRELVVEDGEVKRVVSDKGDFHCRYLVNAAGLYADEIMRLAGIVDFKIKPRRGDYFLLDKMTLVNHVLFPIPTPVSKGILISPTAHGNVLLGPTSLVTDWRDDPPVNGDGLTQVRQDVTRMVPAIDMRQCITVFAGVRPSGSRDFIIGMAGNPGNMLNLAGIESPGLTSAPAIAKYAVSLLGQAGLTLAPNQQFNPIRTAPPRINELTLTEREELIKADPRYGRIICRCEGVTEGEVIAAMHSLIPAETLDAVKKRTRAMTGRCQAGFDTPLLLEIMAREMNVPPWQITKKGVGSEMVIGPTRTALTEDKDALLRR